VIEMKTGIVFSILAILVLSGCTLFSPIETPTQIPLQDQPATDLPPATPTPAASETPAETSTPTETPVPPATPSPAPFVPFEATIIVDNVNLRSNPGYLFSVLRILHVNDTVLVLGKSLGNEWFLVQMNNFVTGWVFHQLVETAGNIDLLPIYQPSNTQLITGRVVNEQGTPISGLQFAFVQGTGASEQRNDAMTNADGIFYAFMPSNYSGEWTVSYVAIACTSNVMDSDCNEIPGMGTTVDPVSAQVTLPYSQELNFTWK
jgi:hypothetical protein